MKTTQTTQKVQAPTHGLTISKSFWYAAQVHEGGKVGYLPAVSAFYMDGSEYVWTHCTMADTRPGSVEWAERKSAKMNADGVRAELP